MTKKLSRDKSIGFHPWNTRGLALSGSIVFLLLCGISPGHTPDLQAESNKSEDNARNSALENSVVRIRSAQENDNEEDPDTEAEVAWQTGTGFVFMRQGPRLYILTVTHVVRGASEIYVEFRARRDSFIPAKVIYMEGSDPNGVALIAVNEFPEEIRSLPLSNLAVKKLQNVRAIGFPRTGADWSVSQGFVTGFKGRSVVFSAQVDGGNSGGPLLDREGRVIGIVTSVKGKYGFATRAAIIKETLLGWGIKLPENNQIAAKYVLKKRRKTFLCSANRNCSINELTPLPNGDVVITGTHAHKEEYFRSEAWIARVDQTHKIIWQVKVGEKKRAYNLLDIRQTPDGGFIAGGYSHYLNSEDSEKSKDQSQALLVRLDKTGRLLWHKLFGGPADDSAYSVTPTPEGDYILVGESESPGGGQKNTWIFRVSSGGKLVWQKITGGPEASSGGHIVATTRGNFLIIGTQRIKLQEHESHSLIKLLKINGSGKILLEKEFGGRSFDQGTMVQETSDQQIYILGKTQSVGNPWYRKSIIIKTNQRGEKIWEKVIRREKEQTIPMNLKVLKNDDILVSVLYRKGSNLTAVAGSRIFKFSSKGKKIWEIDLQGINFLALTLTVNARNLIILGGRTQQKGFNIFPGFLLNLEELKKIW